MTDREREIRGYNLQEMLLEISKRHLIRFDRELDRWFFVQDAVLAERTRAAAIARGFDELPFKLPTHAGSYDQQSGGLALRIAEAIEYATDHGG